MRSIPIDGSSWNSPVDVYDSLLAALNAPAWHGRNLDALWDSLSGGDLNGVKAPFELAVTGSDTWPPEVAALVSKIDILMKEVEASGINIRLTLI